MRVLVTGGAGYVGSHCVRRLIAAGHAVTVYDSLVHGHPQAVPPQAEFVHADLAQTQRLRDVLDAGHFDAVMHFAAFLDVGESVEKPLEYYRNNVANTIGLLECMRDAEVRRIVFSSSCAVYGIPPALPITEDMPTSPINPYGATKLAMEWLLRDCAAAWGLGSICLRYFNAAGAAADGTIGEDHKPEIHLIPVVLGVALGKYEYVRVFGTDYPTPDGTCVRDYIHVDDLAEAHLAALETLQPGKALALNLGTGRGHSVLEVIETARRVTGHRIPALHAPRRPGDPPALYASPARAQHALGWQPRHTQLESIIESAWRWHRSHPDGFGR